MLLSGVVVVGRMLYWDLFEDYKQALDHSNDFQTSFLPVLGPLARAAPFRCWCWITEVLSLKEGRSRFPDDALDPCHNCRMGVKFSSQKLKLLVCIENTKMLRIWVKKPFFQKYFKNLGYFQHFMVRVANFEPLYLRHFWVKMQSFCAH